MYIFTLRVVHYIIQALQLKAADCPGLRSCRTHLFLHSPDAGKIPYSSHALDAQPLFPFSAHDSPICVLPQHSMLGPIVIPLSHTHADGSVDPAAAVEEYLGHASQRSWGIPVKPIAHLSHDAGLGALEVLPELVVPTGQDLHTFPEPNDPTNCPTGQVMGPVTGSVQVNPAPLGDVLTNQPAGQEQSAMSSAPSAAVVADAGHAVQAVMPSLSAYEPRAHLEHPVRPPPL